MASNKSLLLVLTDQEWSISGVISYYYSLYTSDLIWSLFLTSTALHAIILVASPLQAVYKWYRRQCSDSDTPLPYVCALVCSMFWLRYSIFIEDTKLILLQSYAVFMQGFFLVAILVYRSRKRRLLRNVVPVLVVLLIVLLYAEAMSKQSGKKFMGRLASAAQIGGSFVCPYLIFQAVQRKVIDFIPFAPVMLTWVMEIHAIIYSVSINDFYMLLANSIFFFMDGTLLILFFIYPTELPTAEKKVVVV